MESVREAKLQSVNRVASGNLLEMYDFMVFVSYAAWLVANPSFSRLLAVELWLSFHYASYSGAMVVYLTELMPQDVRALRFFASI